MPVLFQELQHHLPAVLGGEMERAARGWHLPRQTRLGTHRSVHSLFATVMNYRVQRMLLTVKPLFKLWSWKRRGNNREGASACSKILLYHSRNFTSMFFFRQMLSELLISECLEL